MRESLQLKLPAVSTCRAMVSLLLKRARREEEWLLLPQSSFVKTSPRCLDIRLSHLAMPRLQCSWHNSVPRSLTCEKSALIQVVDDYRAPPCLLTVLLLRLACTPTTCTYRYGESGAAAGDKLRRRCDDYGGAGGPGGLHKLVNNHGGQSVAPLHLASLLGDPK